MKLNKYYQFKIIIIALILCIDVLCFSTEFENKMREKINISERFMKNKKLQNQNNNFNALYKTNAQSFSLNKNLNSNSNKKLDPVKDLGISNPNDVLNVENEEENKDFIDTNIGIGPVYVTGWIKYFKFVPTSANKSALKDKGPRSFIVNGEFNEQKKLFPNANLEEKSSDTISELRVHIKEKFSFYAVLLRNNLNILSSRQVILNVIIKL